MLLNCGATKQETNSLAEFNREELQKPFGAISFSLTEGEKKTLYFGADLPNGISTQSFSVPPISPTPPALDVRFADGTSLINTDPTRMRVSIQTESPVTLNVERLPKRWVYALQQGSAEPIRLKVGQTYTLAPNTPIYLHKTDIEIPETLVLSQNFPNPFNQSTTLRFGLPEDSQSIRLVIFDIQGREVQRWEWSSLEAGYYNIPFNSTNLASGVYHFQLSVADKVFTNKMTLIR